MRTTYDGLGDFISRLEAEGELLRIKHPVSPVLEITEIADRFIKKEGRALLFENVIGYDAPVLINAYGSKKRMRMSLGVEHLDDIACDIQGLLELSPPESIGDRCSLLAKLFSFRKFPPKTVKSAPSQQVVLTGDDIDIRKIPVLQCWPHDAGRFITFPAVFTKSLSTGRRNVGMYRMQVYDAKTTGMHWHIHKDGAANYHEYRKAGKRMPAAVAIGADPVVTFAATAPMPQGIDELLLAGFIRQKNVELVKCKTIDLEAPAGAEYILEGYVDLSETRAEGPFGDHTGYYSEQAPYPVFHITAITHRKKPVYFTTIVGKPPMEDCFMAEATSSIFLPLLRTQHPEIVNMDLPQEGTFHNCCIISIEKRYPYQARKLMSALWGTGQMSFSKMLLIMDEDMDVYNHKQIVRHLLNNLDPEQDLVLTEGILDVLDHSAMQPLYGAKLGLDITKRVSGEPKRVKLKTTDQKIPSVSSLIRGIPDITGAAVPFSDTKLKMLLVSIKKTQAHQAAKTAKAIWINDTSSYIDIIMVLDDCPDLNDLSYVGWKMFNNINPNRDLVFYDNGKITIDVTKKYASEGYHRQWPKELHMDKKTIDKIDSIWDKLDIDV